MKNVKEQIDEQLIVRKVLTRDGARYIILDPVSRAKLLRICRADSGDSYVTVKPEDGILRYEGVPIAVIKTPETLIDVV